MNAGNISSGILGEDGTRNPLLLPLPYPTEGPRIRERKCLPLRCPGRLPRVRPRNAEIPSEREGSSPPETDGRRFGSSAGPEIRGATPAISCRERCGRHETASFVQGKKSGWNDRIRQCRVGGRSGHTLVGSRTRLASKGARSGNSANRAGEAAGIGCPAAYAC